MLTNPTGDLWIGLGVWALAAVVFGVALWFAADMTKITISWRALLLIVVICSGLVLIPFVGLILAVVVATWLLYRLSDSETGLGRAFLAVLLARGVAVILALGVYTYLDRQRAREQHAVEEQLQPMLNSSTRTNQEPHAGTPAGGAPPSH